MMQSSILVTNSHLQAILIFTFASMAKDIDFDPFVYMGSSQNYCEQTVFA